MEVDCIQSLKSLQERLMNIMKQKQDLPKTFHSLELCIVCQTVDHIKDDLIWYLNNGNETDTKCSSIFQRMDKNESCHHAFNPILDEQIKMECCTVIMWIEPRVEVACCEKLRSLCDVIDVLLDHYVSTPTKTSDYVCFCQVFDNMNLYLTRSEHYILELTAHRSPCENLIRLLGGNLVPHSIGCLERRWRDRSGRLCYLSDGESVVTDLAEKMIYLSFVKMRPDDAIIIRKIDNGDVIYALALPDFGRKGLVAEYSSAYNATQKKWLSSEVCPFPHLPERERSNNSNHSKW
jgi:hypothetical protein